MIIQAQHIFRPVRNVKREAFDNRRSTKIRDMDDPRKVYDFLGWAVKARRESRLENYLKCLK